jgi:hypothetical protein
MSSSSVVMPRAVRKAIVDSTGLGDPVAEQMEDSAWKLSALPIWRCASAPIGSFEDDATMVEDFLQIKMRRFAED